MKIWFCFLSLLLGSWSETDLWSQESEKRATVTMSVFDSFGVAQSGCHVLGFVSFNGDDHSDYKTRFGGLVGQNIPFGGNYRVDIRCADERAKGSFVVAVDRQDEFIVIGTWMHLGDYETGQTPRLTVTLGNSSSESSSGSWIKIVGVYSGRQEVARLDTQSHSVRFYAIEPGRYLMLLVSRENLLCTRQLDILGAEAKMTVSVSGPSCKTGDLSSVRMVN
jgi:hypothetical protein